MAKSLQKLGSRADYIKLSGHGSNALDFHIAYYIGRLAAIEPSAYFHIISRDTGFDPLIQHLRSQKILAGRVRTIANIPVVKTSHSNRRRNALPSPLLSCNNSKLRSPEPSRLSAARSLRCFRIMFPRGRSRCLFKALRTKVTWTWLEQRSPMRYRVSLTKLGIEDLLTICFALVLILPHLHPFVGHLWDRQQRLSGTLVNAEA